MFSKFLYGKDPSTLAALKLQWDMEFAKANRKFTKQKKQKKNSGRPPLGQLNLNSLKKDGKFIDLTNIARNVATTREGRRLHHKVASKLEKPESSNQVCFCYCFAVVLFVFSHQIFLFFSQKQRAYKAWDVDGLGAERLTAALKLVLGDKPKSCRQACREVFGDKFKSVHRTLGNLYQKKYGESIGLAKKLSLKVRQQRLKDLEESGGLELPRPGNPACQPYLTPDEEELIVSFLQTCNFMHMPFNRDAFKVSSLHHVHVHAHTLHAHSHTLPHTHT